MNSDSAVPDLVLHDYGLPRNTFLDDVRRGLKQAPKTLPSKYLYDERGSALFDRITELDVYYPTRTEIGIMQDRVDEMAAKIGEEVLIVEYGSGTSLKTRILLDALKSPAGYVPIDISREHLLSAAQQIAAAYLGLEVLPVRADYMQDIPLPEPQGRVRRRLVYFPGSTIGNFVPELAQSFLDHVQKTADSLLIGVDLLKAREVLELAYNDPQGVTAEFNLNLLRHINRELDADFDVDSFEHEAIFNEEHSRIEMHLVSLRDQEVSIGEDRFAFRDGEHVISEYSYKYTLDGFARMASESGLQLDEVWTDRDRYFSIQLFHAR